MNKRHEIGVNRRGQNLSIHLLLSPLRDKPIKPSTLSYCHVLYKTKQTLVTLRCIFRIAEQSRAGQLFGEENKTEEKAYKTNPKQPKPNSPAAVERDDCDLSCRLIAPLQTSEISQIWKCLWCSLLHKLQHVLIIFSVWLCGTARVRAQRSRPGETLQPERDGFLLLRHV